MTAFLSTKFRFESTPGYIPSSSQIHKPLKELHHIQNLKMHISIIRHYFHGGRTKYYISVAILGQRYSQDFDVSHWRHTLKALHTVGRWGFLLKHAVHYTIMMKIILYSPQ